MQTLQLLSLKKVKAKFELLERSDCASILLYDQSGNVLLLSQFRPGAVCHSPNNPEVLEMISGVIEGNDSPIETAIRESEEESGVIGADIKNIKEIGVFYLSPGGSTERAHIFTGMTDLSKIDLNKVYGLEHESESIKVTIQHVDSVLNDAKNLNINVTLYAALLNVKSEISK